MKKEMLMIFAVLLGSIWSAACNPPGNWGGETYAGKITINDVEPNEASIEKFQLLETNLPDGKKQKYIVLAADNKVIGNCTIPLDDGKGSTANFGKKQTGIWSVPYKSGAACTSAIDNHHAKFVVHSGSVSTNVDETKNDVRFQMIAVNTVDSKSYAFEINAERE